MTRKCVGEQKHSFGKSGVATLGSGNPRAANMNILKAKIWNDHARNEKLLHTVKVERNIQHTTKRKEG
jgi:hypothetical protein